MTAPARPRRLFLLSTIAAVLGVAAGGTAWLLVHLIGFITRFALLGQVAWAEPPSLAGLDPGPRLFAVAMAGGLVVSLLALWSPTIRGHGIPEAMEAVLTRQSRIAPRTAVAKPISAAVSIGTGGPFGAEGPIIVTGGALGSLLGQVIRVSPSERKILLACGAAAGMAATFGAPLASVVLALELLLFEFSTRAFVPLVIASAVAGGMHAALFDAGPFFEVPAHHFAGLGSLPVFAALGLVCGLTAVLLAQGLFLIEAGFRRLPVAAFWHPVIGAAGFATVGLLVPRGLGVGYDGITDILTDRVTIGVAATLAAAKLVAWWIALASGTSGGTLAPILLIAGGVGSLFGHAAANLFPGLGLAPGAFALVAMAATFGAATRATFAAIVFVFELTGDYQVVLPLMLATVVADMLASALLRDSIMTEKLTRRGLRVHIDYEVDPLRTVAIRDIMSSPVNVLPASATIAEARAALSDGRHTAYPLVDADGACVGIVTRTDLLEGQLGESEPVRDEASPDVATVAPDDLAIAALLCMAEEAVDHIPVVADGRLVGIVTRTDLLRANSRRLEHERPQPGWRPHRTAARRAARRAAAHMTAGAAADG
jgi:H+/Cl- antiporter ClcA